jgi:hypothetical protein
VENAIDTLKKHQARVPEILGTKIRVELFSDAVSGLFLDSNHCTNIDTSQLGLETVPTDSAQLAF